MVRYHTLSRDDIAAISALHKAGHSTRDISDQTGVSVRQLQRYVKRITELSGNEIPATKKSPGNTRKTSLRTLRVVHREVERNPRVSARKIREDNLGLLGNVSVRTLSRRIHDDLQYLRYAARPKPVVTVAQQEKRLAFCDRMEAWTIEQWRGVLWSDESRFRVTASSQGRVYRRQAATPVTPATLSPLPHLWTTFVPQHRMTLADSLPARLEECRRCQGKPTKY